MVMGRAHPVGGDRLGPAPDGPNSRDRGLALQFNSRREHELGALEIN
jgi:hypothetical protein